MRLRLWPMPNLDEPPLHTLPHDALIASLGIEGFDRARDRNARMQKGEYETRPR